MWRSQKVLLVVTVAALVAVAIGGFLIGRSVLPSFTTPSVQTPGSITEDLEPGRYTVFERTGTTNQTGPVTISNGRAPLIGPDDISVTGPDGLTIAVARRSTMESISRGTATYSSVAGFDVERAGTYTTRVDGPATEVIQTRSLFDGMARPLLLFASGAIVGGVSVTTLFGIMLVKSSRRRRGEV